MFSIVKQLKLLLLVSLFLDTLLLVPDLCSARNINDPASCTSSCGNIHSISYPFRLKTDPKGCGLGKYYELACENNLTFLTLNSVKYQVQDISYNNFTIRLKDANVIKDDCSSLPIQPLSIQYSTPYYVLYDEEGKLPISLIFIKCGDPVNSPLYVDTSTCLNSSYWEGEGGNYSYVKVEFGYTKVTELVDSCRVELMTMTSWVELKESPNISYLNIHNSMAYGFELGWSVQYSSSIDFSLRVFGHLHVFLFHLLSVLKFLPGFRYYVPEPINIPEDTENIPVIPILFFYYLSLVIVVYRIVLFICGAPCVFALLIYKCRRRHLSMYNNGIEEFLQSQANFMPIRYSYSNIKKITNGFKDKLGQGGFGSVYKGKLRSGRLVAVKMLDKSKANGDDFISELGITGRIHHLNVEQLLGFCVEGSHRALVYEFMANGSLDKFIFSQENNMVLSVEKMYEIAFGVATGIEFLHQGCDLQILHFDIKPHNILLDENFVPKLSNFGLAKSYPTKNNVVSLTETRGTIGYMAPEMVYKTIGDISYKVDVYSFGMLLMEMAGRRNNSNAFAEHTSQIYFPSWAYDQLNNGNDIDIGVEATQEEKSLTKKMVMVALWCIQLKPIDRPAMHKVKDMLERDVKDIEMPPKPALSMLDHTEHRS